MRYSSPWLASVPEKTLGSRIKSLEMVTRMRALSFGERTRSPGIPLPFPSKLGFSADGAFSSCAGRVAVATM